MIKPFIIAAFVISAGAAALFASRTEEEGRGDIIVNYEETAAAQTVHEAENTEDVAADSKETKATSQATQEAVPNPVVYICGAVVKPGLYACTEGSRIADVVDMAGGLLPEADDTCINMAARVSDAQQIIIAKKGEALPAITQAAANAGDVSAASAGSQLINLNTADETALKTLPGIGEQKAKAIIEYRQSSGSFTRPEDVMNVPGIKDGAFNKIKDRITV